MKSLKRRRENRQERKQMFPKRPKVDNSPARRLSIDCDAVQAIEKESAGETHDFETFVLGTRSCMARMSSPSCVAFSEVSID